MTPMNESLVEADKLGRLCDTSEQKKTMVEAYRASGLSAPRFAAHHGLNYQTLVSWIKKAKSSPSPMAHQWPTFSRGDSGYGSESIMLEHEERG